MCVCVLAQVLAEMCILDKEIAVVILTLFVTSIRYRAQMFTEFNYILNVLFMSQNFHNQKIFVVFTRFAVSSKTCH